jgi:multidrug resistance efflux pump
MVVALKTRRRSTFKVLRYVATGVLVVAALIAARHGWRIYMTSPWTRNGMVRAQVANVAPQISGQIVEVRTHDNEHVHKGDVLYVIEKFDFETGQCQGNNPEPRGRSRSQESAERPAGGSHDTVHLD